MPQAFRKKEQRKLMDKALEKRPSPCPHCGQGAGQVVDTLLKTSVISYGFEYSEQRYLYRCSECLKLYEYYWMWEGKKCIIEETVKIKWREPYLAPSIPEDDLKNYTRMVKRVDLRYVTDSPVDVGGGVIGGNKDK